MGANTSSSEEHQTLATAGRAARIFMGEQTTSSLQQSTDPTDRHLGLQLETAVYQSGINFVELQLDKKPRNA